MEGRMIILTFTVLFCLLRCTAATKDRGLLQSMQPGGPAPAYSATAPVPSVSTGIATQSGINYMVYFSGVNKTAAQRGSVLLTLQDSLPLSSTRLDYTDLRFYPNQAGETSLPILGKHLHTLIGPFVQYDIDVVPGSVNLSTTDYQNLLSEPSAFYVGLHLASSDGSAQLKANGQLPSLVTTLPLGTSGGGATGGTVTVSFQDDAIFSSFAVCIYNLRLTAAALPSVVEVDIIAASGREPLIVVKINTTTVGQCVASSLAQISDLKNNLHDYSLRIPQQAGIDTPISVGLDAGLHSVSLFSPLNGALVGGVRVAPGSPNSLCYYDLSYGAGNVTGIALHDATTKVPLLTFNSTPFGPTLNTSSGGCAVNVGPGILSRFNATGLVYVNVTSVGSAAGGALGLVQPIGSSATNASQGLPQFVALPAMAPGPQQASTGLPPVLTGSPVSSVATRNTIDFMVYFSSQATNKDSQYPATGSAILSFPDVIGSSSSANNSTLTYSEVRLYTGVDQAGTISGIHIHRQQGPSLQLSLGLGNGSVSVDGQDMLRMLASPADYFMEVHSSTVASPGVWASGPFPEFVTVVVLTPPDGNVMSNGQGQATVQLAFHEAAVCAYNARFNGLAPPSPIEVDLFNGTQSVPLFKIVFPPGTTGQCYPLQPGQAATITSNLQNYRVQMPGSAGGSLPLSGRLDNSVREVAMSSDAEQPSPVPGHALGKLHLVALTSRSLCYWQLKFSSSVKNWTAMHIHQGSPSDVGPVIVPFYPLPPLDLLNPTGGCKTNVSADPMTLYAQASPNIYMNVHNAEYQDGFMRGQLPAWGVVPANLPTAEQLASTGGPGSNPPSSSSSSVGAIAGAVGGACGAAAVLLGIVLAIILCRRKRRRSLQSKESLESPEPKDLFTANKQGGYQSKGWLPHGNAPSFADSPGSSRQSPAALARPRDLEEKSISATSSVYWAEQENMSVLSDHQRTSLSSGGLGKSAEYAPRGSSKGEQGLPRSNEKLAHLTSRMSSDGHPSSLVLQGDVLTVTQLSIQEVLEITHNFQAEEVIGEGSFGVVYRATLPNGSEVAVKRAGREALRSVKVFRTEIQLLSRLHHNNLVDLVAYCYEPDEQVLIYRYMSNGNLRTWLQSDWQPRLSWMARLQIALGTAHGLNYLHTGASPQVIHRDVKSSNILLDENFVPKVADFGFGYVSATVDQRRVSKMSNAVCGTPGYVDPEYYETGQVTDKSDVYAFGVILLELLTSKSALFKQGNRQVNLALKMRPLVTGQINDLSEVLEPIVAEQAARESIAAIARLAGRCISITSPERPTMAAVCLELQHVLLVEESGAESVNVGFGHDDRGSNAGSLNLSQFLGR